MRQDRLGDVHHIVRENEVPAVQGSGCLRGAQQLEQGARTGTQPQPGTFAGGAAYGYGVLLDGGDTYTCWTVAIMAATSLAVTTGVTLAKGETAWWVSSISISASRSG